MKNQNGVSTAAIDGLPKQESKDGVKLRDASSERSLIGTIVKYGKDALLDTQGILSSSDFGAPINRAIFTALEKLADEPNCEKFDPESIKLKMNTLGLGDYASSRKAQEYIDLLEHVNFDKGNIPLFAYQVKKYSIVRDLHSRYKDATNYLENMTGDENVSDILREAEGKVVDFVTGIDNGNSLENLTENLEEYIMEKLEEEEVDQVGLPTGYPIWDTAIGGGPRRGTVTMIGARPKVSKSFLALNTGINVAKRKVPVLYLDTELTKDYQKNRMICINSGCPLYLYETGKFKHNKDLVRDVIESARLIDNIPLHYQSVNGMTHTEVLAFVRRWLVKHVGFNQEGKANDCLIIYDYMKLTSGSSLTKFTPEYIVLGLMITDFHTFAVKHDVPIVSFVQLNRDGIDGEEGNVISGSDRILWLCSSMSLLKNKDENDIGLGCGWEYGNKKLVIMETRHGAGLENYGDYINLKCSLRPQVSMMNGCGHIREGLLFSEIAGQNASQNVQTPKR